MNVWGYTEILQVWLLGEAATATNILICDYLVSRGKVREFLNPVTVANIPMTSRKVKVKVYIQAE